MGELCNSCDFGQTSVPNNMIGEKQVLGHESSPSEAKFQMELENDTVAKEIQVIEMSKDELGSSDTLLEKPVEIKNAVSNGFSSEGVGVNLNFGQGSETQQEGDINVKGKDDFEAVVDNLKVEQNAESKDYAIKSSQMEGAQISMVEQVENLPSDTLKNCSTNQGEGALDVKGKDDFEAGADSVKVEQIDDARESSQMEFAPISMVQQVEKLDSNTLKNCGTNQGEGALDTIAKDDSEAGVGKVKAEKNAECKDDAMDSSQTVGALISIVEQVENFKSAMLKNCDINQGEAALDLREKDDSEAGADYEKVEQNAESKVDAIDSSKMKGTQKSMVEQVKKLHSDTFDNFGTNEENECDAGDTQASPNDQSTKPLKEADEKLHIIVLGVPATTYAIEKPRRGRKPAAISRNKQSPRSVGSTRSLRSRSKENSEGPEPSVANLETAKGNTRRRGRKRRKEKDGKIDDEFSKMRKHLRYLLHRIHYEQNLLDAYSSEGWRGQSIEKLRPEKELQRAKADINRSKLKIRDLFQRLDSMTTEGKFPDSLYDSEGLIDSEDIFCAKCGSKDLSVGNDIILCDGICDRGFHQYCLDQPLRTEEIPPGDEGWLCPACDCKVDCIELLNDAHGTKLAIGDNWEKVFPEALAVTAGKGLDDITGLPSDDSEDNEYNPDGTDDDANVEGNESTFDESDSSDFSSASEDLGVIRGAEKNIGLSSDDSEDNDYDPDAANVKEEAVEHKSSSSDFTSASEDLNAAIGDERTSSKDEPPLPLDTEQESSPITGKRCLERLDYKKLYDETYANAASDSSDDEEWMETRKRKSGAEKAAIVLGASGSAVGTCGSGAPQRRGRPKANLQVTNRSPAQLQESFQKTSSGGSSKKRPPYKRLGEAVTQRLYESFKENQYPDRQAKEKLANELGLTVHRVDKWFGNARWSLNHHPSRAEASMTRAVSHIDTPHGVACNGGDRAAVPECVSADTSKLDVTTRKKLTPKRSRMKNAEGDQSMNETSKTENMEGTQTDRLQTPEALQGIMQKRRRKASA